MKKSTTKKATTPKPETGVKKDTSKKAEKPELSKSEQRRIAAQQKAKEPKHVVITQDDLDAHPILVENGLKVGDIGIVTDTSFDFGDTGFELPEAVQKALAEKPTVTPDPVKKEYHVILVTAEKEYTFDVDELSEIAGFKPEKIAGKSTLTIQRDGKEFTKIVRPMILTRLLANHMHLTIFQKNANTLLK